jgi:hypothetical protein
MASPEPPPIPAPATDRFSIRASYFRPAYETIVRLDADLLTPGTVINAEEDLALDDVGDLGRMEVYFRLGERNRVRVDYLKINRFGDTVLARDIDFGNDTFLAGERVQSVLDFRSFALTYTYSFFRGETFEIGAGIGVHLMELEAIAEAVDRLQREEDSGIAPFPSVALDGSWRFARRWAIAARAQSYSGSYKDNEGDLTEFHIDVQYRWKPNLTLGLGYSSFEFDAVIREEDFPGLFNIQADGPEFFVRASF